MTPRLDRSKPFGELIPSGGFWQDGHYFDVQGNFLHSEGDVPAPEAQVETPPPAVSEAQVIVDLAAWAKGEAKYPHFKVVQAMQDVYPDAEFAKNRAGMLDFLIAQGVVAETEVAR